MSRKRAVRPTPEQMKAREREEWNQHVVDEAVREAETRGPLSTSHSEVGGKKIAVTDAQLAEKSYVASSKGCLKPAHIQTKAGVVVRVIFTQPDYEALMQGYFCARCWEQQEGGAAHPEWVVSSRPQVCRSVLGRSCGFPRGAKWVRRLPYEVSVLPRSK